MSEKMNRREIEEKLRREIVRCFVDMATSREERTDSELLVLEREKVEDQQRMEGQCNERVEELTDNDLKDRKSGDDSYIRV